MKELIDDLTDNRITLSAALTKAKLIASKLKDEKLKIWLSHELLGYPKDKNLVPDYRIVPCTIVGVLQHVNGLRQNVEIPSSKIDKELRDKFERVFIYRSISDIESISEKNLKSQFIHMPFEINLLAILNNLLKMDFDEQAIVEGSLKIFAQDFKRIIDVTKHKLIEILFELHETFPHFENALVVDKEIKDKSNQIFENHIHMIINNQNSQTMSNDNYENKGQAIVVGPNANVKIKDVHQENYAFPDSFNYNKLIEELAQLKAIVIREASNTNDADKFRVVSEIIEAEKAAETQDQKKVLKHLANGGKWLFETAKEIGVSIAAEAIKKSLGM